MNFIKEIYSTFLDVLFPRYCFTCDKKIVGEDNYFCSDCYSDLKYYDFNKSLLEDNEKDKRGFLDGIYSYFYFEPDSISQRIIHLIKYENKPKLGFLMGTKFGNTLLEKEIKGDLIIPVPLHKSRKRERGYNQSEMICNGIASVLKIQVNSKIISRKRNTKSQTKLTREERIENVYEAFSINSDLNLNTKTVFIFDDVITSGATISECARLLKSNYNIRIIALSLAYVRNHHNILSINT